MLRTIKTYGIYIAAIDWIRYSYYLLHKSLFQSTCNGFSYINYKHIANRLDRYHKLSPHIRNFVKWKDFKSQHQWMILHRGQVKKCLEAAPKILPHFSRVHAVDEHFFVTLFQILGILEKEFINQKTTYCDWSDSSSMHPKTFHRLTNQFVYNIQSSGCFFLRKVSNQVLIGPYLEKCLTNFRKDKIKG